MHRSYGYRESPGDSDRCGEGGEMRSEGCALPTPALPAGLLLGEPSPGAPQRGAVVISFWDRH